MPHIPNPSIRLEEAQSNVPLSKESARGGLIKKVRKTFARVGASSLLRVGSMAAPLAVGAAATVTLAPNVAEARKLFAEEIGLATKDAAIAAVGGRTDKEAQAWLAAIKQAWDTRIKPNSPNSKEKWEKGDGTTLGDGAPFITGGKYAAYRTNPPPPAKVKLAPPRESREPRQRHAPTPAATSTPDGKTDGSTDGNTDGSAGSTDSKESKTPWGWIVAGAAGLWGALQRRGKKKAEETARYNRLVTNSYRRAEAERQAAAMPPREEPPIVDGRDDDFSEPEGDHEPHA